MHITKPAITEWLKLHWATSWKLQNTGSMDLHPPSMFLVASRMVKSSGPTSSLTLGGHPVSTYSCIIPTVHRCQVLCVAVALPCQQTDRKKQRQIIWLVSFSNMPEVIPICWQKMEAKTRIAYYVHRIAYTAALFFSPSGFREVAAL